MPFAARRPVEIPEQVRIGKAGTNEHTQGFPEAVMEVLLLPGLPALHEVVVALGQHDRAAGVPSGLQEPMDVSYGYHLCICWPRTPHYGSNRDPAVRQCLANGS